MPELEKQGVASGREIGLPRFVGFGGEFGSVREKEGRGERVKSGWRDEGEEELWSLVVGGESG